MSAVLDTSVLISDWRPADDESCAVSVCSIAELHFGVLRAADLQARSRRLQRLAAVESAFDPIPVDESVARAYAECASAVVDAGRNPRPRSFDLVIAATARVHQARLITLNPDDFRGLEALVEIYCPVV
jgi:hypothetical protein